MDEVPLPRVGTNLSRRPRLAGKNAVAVARRDTPAGLLTGFVGEDDWLLRLRTNP